MRIKKYILLIFVLIISFLMLKDTKYYEGEVSDHFDGKSFFDPSKNREASFYSFLSNKYYDAYIFN